MVAKEGLPGKLSTPPPFCISDVMVAYQPSKLSVRDHSPSDAPRLEVVNCGNHTPTGLKEMQGGHSCQGDHFLDWLSEERAVESRVRGPCQRGRTSLFENLPERALDKGVSEWNGICTLSALF